MNATPQDTLYPRISALINTVLNLEKGRTFQIHGQRIYPSEVHLLLDLARSPDANSTDLARNLGLTKGAVSQTLTRLERKGLVVKSRDPANRNALNLEFTALGTETVAHFREKTSRMRARVEEHLVSLTAADREVIGNFLEQLTASLGEMRGGE